MSWLPKFEEIPSTDAPRLDEIPPIVLPKSPNHLSGQKEEEWGKQR